MLTSETKRHIDSARQVLVGKVPNPISQVQEITNALIYKFMDDMDERAASVGGKRSYFAGEYEKYSWRKIMAPSIGSQERISLYVEALSRLSKNPDLPELFRGIFRNAYLPFNDGRTLTLFLKEIDYFDYKHSEELGNAYEYLLSIMGSQGDAGQFRTPRHIIDFIVDAVDPGKNDSVLDPACGTAGFLISAYKHVVSKHDGKDEKTGDYTADEAQLTADEKTKLHKNYKGFDIDDNMVKMSQVNMFLHGFKDPNVIVHDSLSSEDYWADRYDVILANPPFMTPKGGIVPHNKFGVQSNRAEVLFVDYIKSHLKPSGRAGVIVPEGIIFQSGNAYKQLRKSLIEDGLYAVVSLPSGVFNPYAGVKTSILLFNNELAKQKSEILLIKVENDGFDLGAQRRAYDKNDLIEALDIINSWVKGNKVETKLASYVDKSIIAKDGEYNLSGDRYHAVVDYSNAKWPLMELKDVIKLNFGARITKNEKLGKVYPVYGGGGESFRTDDFNRENEFVISRFAMSEKCVRFVSGKFWLIDSGGSFSVKPNLETKLSKKYVGLILLNKQEAVYRCARGGAQKNLNVDHFYEIKIPIPPLEIQEQIVTELDGYQNIINGAKQIVTNWKPSMPINPEWGTVNMGVVASFNMGGTPAQSEINTVKSKIPWVKGSDLNKGYIFSTDNFITKEGMNNSRARYYDIGTVLVGRTGQGKTRGTVALLKIKATTNETMIGISPLKEKLDSGYLYYLLGSRYAELRKIGGENERGGLTQRDLKELMIVLPSLKIQKQIVEKIEAEREIVDANNKLIEIYERKIKDTIDKLWEE